MLVHPLPEQKKNKKYPKRPPRISEENKEHPKTQYPHNAENWSLRKSAFSGVLRFRVLFVPLKDGAKPRPKMQDTWKRRFSHRSVFCVSGVLRFRVLFCARQQSLRVRILQFWPLIKQFPKVTSTRGHYLRSTPQQSPNGYQNGWFSKW